MSTIPAPSAVTGFESYRDAPTLVLGGAGFIGARLAHALDRAGADVSLAVRDGGEARVRVATFGRIPHIEVVDLASRGEATRVVRALRPTIVFNLAVHGVDPSERDPALMRVVNVALVTELLEAVGSIGPNAWAGQRVIQIGSALEYGAARGALSEETPTNPTTEYGRTKLDASLRVAAAAREGLAASVARLFTVYGPGEHPGRLLPSLIAAARSGERVELSSGVQRRDFTYVDDVVEGLLRLGLSSPAPDEAIVNLATGRLTSVREFVERAAAILPIDPSKLAFGARDTRAEEMWHDEVDLTRLCRRIDWVPGTTVAEGVRRSWEEEHAHR